MKKSILLSIALLTLSPLVHATTVYSYVGNNFTGIEDNNPPNGTYDKNMRVEVSFALAEPIGPNTTFASITSKVLDYSFFDGRNLITRNPSVAFLNISVGTDDSGLPIEWEVETDEGCPMFFGQGDCGMTTSRGRSGIFDTGRIRLNLDSDAAFVFGAPGQWSLAANPVPLPAAVWLFVFALGGLGFNRVHAELADRKVRSAF